MFTTAQLNRIIALADQGNSEIEIARQLGLPQSTFRDRLRESGYRIVLCRRVVPIVPVGLSTPEPER